MGGESRARDSQYVIEFVTLRTKPVPFMTVPISSQTKTTCTLLPYRKMSP